MKREVMFADTQEEAVARKKVLLRVLAARDVERTGIRIEASEVQAVADDFRLRYGLLDVERMKAWLDVSGLTQAAFSRLMREVAQIQRLEAMFEKEIDAGLGEQFALTTAAVWNAGRKG